jgi:hypothetical protein
MNEAPESVMSLGILSNVHQSRELPKSLSGLLRLEIHGRVPQELYPANLTVQRVVGAIVEADVYVVLAAGASGVTTFRTDVR